MKGQSRLNIFSLPPPVSSRTLCLFNVRKLMSSAPTDSIDRISDAYFQSSNFGEKNPSSRIRISFQVQGFQKPTSGDIQFSQNYVVDKLLTFADNPVSALRLYKEAEKRLGFMRNVEVSFFVLLHILVRSRDYHGVARCLINDYLSRDTAPSGDLLIDAFNSVSERCGFEMKHRILHYFLNGYVKAGRYKDAEDCFYVLISRGSVQCAPILNVLLKSLLKFRMFNEAHSLFRDMVLKKLEYDSASVYMMMRASLIEGKVDDALEYFLASKESRVELNAPVYITAIRVACMKMETRIAIELLREMKKRGWLPSEGTYTLLICALVKQGKMMNALKLKDQMCASGHSLNLVVATSLMKGYCQLGNLHSSLALFDEIVESGLVPNKVTYAVLIEGCSMNGDLQRAGELYQQMKSRGIQPSVYIANSLIGGYLKVNSVDKAMELFNEAVKLAVVNVFTYNHLLWWFCQQGSLDDAYGIWDKMLDYGIKPNVFSYGILMDGCFRRHEVEKGLALYDHMIDNGVAPSDIIFNTIISGLCRVGRTAAAKERMAHFVTMGFNPSCITYNSLIDGFMKEGNPNSAMGVYSDMLKVGISPSVVTYTTLINGFSKNGNLDLALKMQERIRARVTAIDMDLMAYNALIDAFCKKNDTRSALELFDEIQVSGLSPNCIVYNTMIAGYRDSYETKAMLELYKRMTKEGVRCDFATYTTLIDGLMNVGSTERASELYHEMISKDISPDSITYCVLVDGLCRKRQTESARMLLDEMLRKKVTPNEHVYNTLIASYFREGKLSEAFTLHDEMVALGIVPNDDTYDVLVSESSKTFLSQVGL